MFLNELSSFLTPQQISIDPKDLDSYSRDWTKHYTPKASALLFPYSTEEVQKVVLWAIKHKISLIPSGGRTGLSAGAMALNGEIVVSLEKMNKIIEFDTIGSIVHCQAGVITEQLQNFAKDHGLFYPIDFAAKGSSQIGGNIATNAGGIKVLRYGLTRQWITGLTVVTGKGDILRLNHSLVKNATGYDLRHLFIGSEGTLGFITEAEIQLTVAPPPLSVLILGLYNTEDIMSVYREFQNRTSLTAFEMFTEKALLKVMESQKLQRPFNESFPFYLVVETENPNDETFTSLTETFEILFEKGWIGDGAISQSPQQSKDFWRLRESISESISVFMPYKNDISVRISLIPDFLKSLDELIEKNYPEFEVIVFGHIGDGNLHVNILKPSSWSSEDFKKKCSLVNEQIFSQLEKFRGSISAEHGVGLVKKEGLKYSKSPEELEIFKQIKSIFDPYKIINPGKLTD